jgi:hypothetical protein
MTERVSIYGYRWHDSPNGNTYHSVIVFADGEELYRSPSMEYGYEQAYEETGFREFLKATGQKQPDGPKSARHWFEDHGIHYTTKVYDVKQQKELFMFPALGG